MPGCCTNPGPCRPKKRKTRECCCEDPCESIPVSKGGKVLGYLYCDPAQPEDGPYVMTVYGREIYPNKKEQKDGTGYVWTDLDVVTMIRGEPSCQPCPQFECPQVRQYCPNSTTSRIKRKLFGRKKGKFSSPEFSMFPPPLCFPPMCLPPCPPPSPPLGPPTSGPLCPPPFPPYPPFPLSFPPSPPYSPQSSLPPFTPFPPLFPSSPTSSLPSPRPFTSPFQAAINYDPCTITTDDPCTLEPLRDKCDKQMETCTSSIKLTKVTCGQQTATSSQGPCGERSKSRDDVCNLKNEKEEIERRRSSLIKSRASLLKPEDRKRRRSSMISTPHSQETIRHPGITIKPDLDSLLVSTSKRPPMVIPPSVPSPAKCEKEYPGVTCESPNMLRIPLNTSRIVILKRSAGCGKEKSTEEIIRELQKSYECKKDDREYLRAAGSDDEYERSLRKRKWYFEGTRYPARKHYKKLQ